MPSTLPTPSAIHATQLLLYPDTVFVSPNELARLCEKHLGERIDFHGRTMSWVSNVNDVAHSRLGSVCYCVPQPSDRRPFLGIRFSPAHHDYASFG